MGDKNNNNQQELKNHMNSLFDFSSRIPYQKSHLITTLQAAKSLIGINPTNPPEQMLKWIESYISKYSDFLSPQALSGYSDKTLNINSCHSSCEPE